MSRSITIPEYKNPFVVIINNNVYQYRGGETVEVPDEVAEAIEDALRLVPKPKRYLSKFAQFANGTLTEIKAEDLEGIEIISTFTFYNNDYLTRVVIPQGVTCIEPSAFSYCSRLTRVTMPDSITSINEKAFMDCIVLKSVVLKAKKPPIIEENTFTSVPTTCVFEVPAESVEAYKSAQYWSALASQIKAIEE